MSISDLTAIAARRARYRRPPPLIADNLHVRLFTAAYALITEDGWTFASVQDSFWRLYLNHDAGASLELREGVYPLEPGQLYLVPAGVYFDCVCHGDVRHFYIHFDLAGLTPLALRSLFTAPLPVPTTPAFLARIAAMESTFQQSGSFSLATQCRLKALVYEVFAAYLDNLPPDTVERCWQHIAAHAAIVPALDFIADNLGNSLSNDRLARLCHLQEDYFIRRFRELTGASPQRYVTAQRVTAAAQQLLFGTESIEAIAAGTGFPNRNYFTRVFTRQTGTSPAAYRKAVRR